MNRGVELRARLKEGGLIGGHVFFNDPAITESMAEHLRVSRLNVQLFDEMGTTSKKTQN